MEPGTGNSIRYPAQNTIWACLLRSVGWTGKKAFYGGIEKDKTELISAVALKAELTKKDSENAVAAVFDAITEALVAGDSVSLVGFGKFEVKNRSEKMGINPRTKEPMKIAASKLPAFRAGKALKDAVAK